MTLDPSLKSSGGMTRHRNVLTRAERIQRLVDKGGFDMESGEALGLAKTVNRQLKTGGKKKKAASDDEAK